MRLATLWVPPGDKLIAVEILDLGEFIGPE